MDLFISKYFNKVDKKGRVSLPSSFRNALPKSNKNEIILYKSIKTPSIEGCGIGRLAEIAKRINNLDFFSDDHDTGIYSWNYLSELCENQEKLWNDYLKKIKDSGSSR